MPRTSPSCRCLSSSSLVFSSRARMSSIVRPCHLSIQQNTCLQGTWETLSTSTWNNIICISSPMESCEKSSLRLLDKTFYSPLKSEPFELACYELVTRHHGLHFLSPVGSSQWTATSFWRLESGKEMEKTLDIWGGHGSVILGNHIIDRTSSTTIDDWNSLGWIFRFLVISRSNWIVGDVNVDDFAYLQLITSQLVNLFSIVDVKRK